MTQDEIADLYQKANGWNPGAYSITMTELEHFAKLVAAKEREACAEICKKHADIYGVFEPTPSFQAAWAACIDLRDKIQARGEA